MNRVDLDTNILLRLVQTESPEHRICQARVRERTSRSRARHCRPGGSGVLVVATRPAAVNGLGWQPEFARSRLDLILAGVQVLPEPADTFARWLDLVTTKPVLGKRAHDARIAATLVASEVWHLLTLNGQDITSFSDPVAQSRTGAYLRQGRKRCRSQPETRRDPNVGEKLTCTVSIPPSITNSRPTHIVTPSLTRNF